MNISELLGQSPYSLDRKAKSALLNQALMGLTHHHYSNCEPYRKILDGMGFDAAQCRDYRDIPFLPARLFKAFDLMSIDKDDVHKTLTSSGTSGQAVSKIYLDKQSAINQTKTLTNITSNYLGTKRVPMLILDSASVMKNRHSFSARAAGILGFSIFGTKREYALNDDMQLDMERVTTFIETHKHSRIFLFGFTFMVYQHFIKTLLEKGLRLDLSNGVLIHGGGWKALEHESLSPEAFREKLIEVANLRHVHDYYGMVEQTGSIYVECEHGHLHASNFSDVIIRQAHDFSEAAMGERGIIQTLSLLPKSYPGHSLLTEDEGVLLGEDDCPCGRLGKYFKVFGRIQNAEIRGCSNTYAAQF